MNTLGHVIYSEPKIKASKSLKSLLDKQEFSLLGLRYKIIQTDVGMIAALRSQDELIKELEPLFLELHTTLRKVLNAIYSGCNHFKEMYLSQKFIARLCGISERHANRVINILWKLGFFYKKRRWSNPGASWKSCLYKLPNWLLKSKVRNYFSSLFPALGDPIQWHGVLCCNREVINSSLTSSYSKVVAYEDINARARDTKSDNLSCIEPPKTSNIPKSTKELLNPFLKQHQLPLVTQQEKIQQGRSMQPLVSRSYSMDTFVEREARRRRFEEPCHEQWQADEIQLDPELFESGTITPLVAPAPPKPKKSQELEMLQLKYLASRNSDNKAFMQKEVQIESERWSERTLKIKAQIEALILKEANGTINL